MRAAVRLALVTLLGLVACLEPITSPALGGAMSVVMPAGPAPLDSGHVVLKGPTNKTVTVTPGSSVTIDSLSPGSYTVALEGFQGGGVAYFTQVTGVTVSAGQSTAPTIPSFPVFQAPTILSIPAITVTGQVTVVYSSVLSSNGYIVQRDTLATFATSHDTTVAAGDTSVQVTIPLKAYKVRVRALDLYGAVGNPSAVAAVAAIASLTVTPAAATLSPVAPTDTQRFTATAKDANGITVAGVTFLWVSSNPNVAIVDQTGLATAIEGGTTTISAAGLGVPGGASLTVTGGVPKALVYTAQPASTTAGTAFSPAIQIEIRDTNNQIIPTARNPVTLAITGGPGGATLVGTATVNAIAGVASFSGLNIQKAGAGYALTATSSGLVGATSSAFAVSPSAAASLTFTSPPTLSEGNVAITPAVAVTILDAYNNVATSATNSVTLAIGNNPWETAFAKGGTLAGTVTKAAVAGVATFGNVSLDQPANGYTLVASATGLTTATSGAFRVRLTISSISAGGYHTCAVAAGGTYCWGTDYYGEIGETPGFNQDDSVPNLVPGGLTFTQLTTGYYHSCGITATGVAYCWGADYDGQLGNGTTTGSIVSTPQLVVGGHTFTSISAGDYHACGVGVGGLMWCWGYNGNGQLGNGTVTQAPTPVKVTGAQVWTTVSAGGSYTCGTSNAANTNGYCWGYNYYGQLGDSATVQTLAPAGVKSNTAVGFSATATGFAYITTGELHSCGLLTTSGVATGNLVCWGYNNDGELGNSATAAKDSAPVVVTGALTWDTVSAGPGGYFVCGVRGISPTIPDCWGSDTYGQLGDGAPQTQQDMPVQVSGAQAFSTITSGAYHACGLLGTTVYCWGQDYNGQLGIGSTTQQKNTPTIIVQ